MESESDRINDTDRGRSEEWVCTRESKTQNRFHNAVSSIVSKQLKLQFKYRDYAYD